ncbi:hypothetical protein LFZ32_03140, partial [Salmonella enterica subsp. enterica serovar Newport str. L0167]
ADPRKAAVEAAIARAKARKTGAAGRKRTCRTGRSDVKPRWKRPSPAPKLRKQEQQAGSEPAEPADPRKAAVAAAIARVQAKKAAQQQVVNED